MKTIGITGGIGSGKSTFCGYLRDFGAFTVDMDIIARDILSHDAAIQADVVRHFGPESYLPTGKLNRAYLAHQAFTEGRIQELNRITHPAVYRRVEQLEAFAREEGVRVFVKESAILLGNGRPEGYDAIVLVHVPEAERIRRVMGRDASQESHIRERIRQQKTDEEMRPLCDIVIDNTGDLAHLRAEAERCFRLWDA